MKIDFIVILSVVARGYKFQAGKAPAMKQNGVLANSKTDAGGRGNDAKALRHKLRLICDRYHHFMQKIVNSPAITFDVDPTHLQAEADLDFIQNFDSNGSTFGTFMPHLVIFALILGARFLYF